ncbi:hypothetical protein HIR71_06875 [Cellulomonas fimi]|uniref:ATP synthase protein I n=1 Tax=Cellulomonas fimi TaxID=1708 RepID=A0A7Y0LYW5_CELFI|nr:hypothetical protein [Cellulomonas fimi]
MPGSEAARAVFRTALRDMLVLVAVVAVLGLAVGYLTAGVPGVWGAVLGVVLTLVFSGTTVVSMLVTAASSAQTTAAVVLGGWLAKMVVLVAVLALLRDQTFYDRVVLAVVLLVGVLGSVLLDFRAVRAARIPYVEPPVGE